jgi:hypothetical protein
MSVKIYDQVVPTTTTRFTINLSSTPLIKGKLYRFEFYFQGLGTGSSIAIEVNGNTTESNYVRQRINTGASAVGTSRSESNDIAYVSDSNDNKDARASGYFRVTNNDRAIIYSDGLFRINEFTTTGYIWEYMIASKFTVTSITSLAIFSQAGSNRVYSGSRFQIWEVGEQTQSVLVASNTTEISLNLKMEKNNTYLLLSEQVASAGASTLNLLVNNDADLENYNTQKLSALNTVLSQSRLNSALLQEANINTSVIGFTYLNLSNNGYFNWQSHICKDYTNITTFEINKIYGSKPTQENLVTNLKIRSAVPNTIGTNSLFELYRLT